MTAAQFADATWLVVTLVALLCYGEKTWRWCFGLVAMWLVAVVVLAIVRG